MTTFTINDENEIVAFGSQEEAAAATTTPFDSFATQQELAELAAAWPAERFVAIWNSLAGVVRVKKFKNTKTAISRIWARIQGLGEAAKPAAEPAKQKATKKAKGRTQAAKGAPAKGKSSTKAIPAKAAPKGKKAVQAAQALIKQAFPWHRSSFTKRILQKSKELKIFYLNFRQVSSSTVYSDVHRSSLFVDCGGDCWLHVFSLMNAGYTNSFEAKARISPKNGVRSCVTHWAA